MNKIRSKDCKGKLFLHHRPLFYPLLGRKNMKTFCKLFVLFSTVAALLGIPSYAQDQKVKNELADMIEAAVKETGLSINISAMNYDSVTIDKVNGRNVCSKEAKNDVVRLQEAFNRHPNIYKNIGPYLVSFTYKDGTRKVGDITELRKQGKLPDCTNIMVSVH